MPAVPMSLSMLMGALMLITSGGGLGRLPLAMPPGELDPVMSRVAPDNCLLYLSWAGTADASADSDNRTEQLLADPEVRRLLEGLEQRLTAALEEGAGQGDRGQVIAKNLPLLLKTLATRPAAFFVGQVNLDQRGLDTPVGLVVNVRGLEEELQTAIKAVEHALGSDEAPTSVEADGREWRQWPTPLGVPPVLWSVFDGYLIAAVGIGTHTKILERLEGESTPDWLAAVQKRLPVERQAMISHVNVSGIIENVKQFLGPAAPQVLAVLQQLGIHNAQSLTTVTGLEGEGCVTRTWLEVDGELTGILEPLGAKPLAASDLSPIPADAAAAFAVRLDAATVLKQFSKLLKTFDPRAAADIESGLEQFHDEVGFDVHKALAALDDSWCVYQSPSEGGSLMIGWTAVVGLRDHAKVKEVAAIIAKNARQIERDLIEQLGRRGVRSLSVGEYELGGHKVYFLNAVGERVPVAPAWCVTDDELVLSLFPQGINAYLRRSQTDSLADNPVIANGLERDQPPLMLGYYDTKRLLRLGWPLVQMLTNVAFAELQQQGLDLDISLLPSLSAIEQYVSGASFAVVPSDDGVELISRRVLPVGPEMGLAAAASLLGVRSVAAPFAFATIGPLGSRSPLFGMSPLDALSPVRAQRTQSTHKLKQIGLAMHNHHDTFKTFPDEAVRDDAGEPLLSWRVKLLPFLGERELFDRFRMNEPWDSPHNKPLIEQIPNVFKVPGVEMTVGKTSYVGIVGKGTLFDPIRPGMRMREITDGTSNTLLVVEASPKSAVIWTKPDDLPLSAEDMTPDLVGARRGGFLGLTGDGAIHFLPEQMSEATILNLAIRNDGIAVNIRNLPQRTVPRSPSARATGTTRRPATSQPPRDAP